MYLTYAEYQEEKARQAKVNHASFFRTESKAPERDSDGGNKEFSSTLSQGQRSFANAVFGQNLVDKIKNEPSMKQILSKQETIISRITDAIEGMSRKLDDFEARLSSLEKIDAMAEEEEKMYGLSRLGVAMKYGGLSSNYKADCEKNLPKNVNPNTHAHQLPKQLGHVGFNEFFGKN